MDSRIDSLADYRRKILAEYVSRMAKKKDNLIKRAFADEGYPIPRDREKAIEFGKKHTIRIIRPQIEEYWLVTDTYCKLLMSCDRIDWK